MKSPARAQSELHIADMGAKLEWLAASLDAVAERHMNRFTRCLTCLEEPAKDLGSPVAVVGGLAAIHHGAKVATLDIDIAVSKDKLEAILEVGPRHGLRVKDRSAAGWHRFVFEHSGDLLEVHVIPEGSKSPRDPPHAPPNPGPRDLGVSEGFGYAAFGPWAVMKLIAGRDKDRYHLVEAFKQASETEISNILQRPRLLHPTYLKELERLVRAAEEEKGQETW